MIKKTKVQPRAEARGNSEILTNITCVHRQKVQPGVKAPPKYYRIMFSAKTATEL